MVVVIGFCLILLAVGGLRGVLDISIFSSLALAVIGILFVCVGADAKSVPQQPKRHKGR